MSKIEKPVKIELKTYVCDYRQGWKTVDYIRGCNDTIDQSDKYWEQEMAKQELLRVELEMKLKDMEQEMKKKDEYVESLKKEYWKGQKDYTLFNREELLSEVNILVIIMMCQAREISEIKDKVREKLKAKEKALKEKKLKKKDL